MLRIDLALAVTVIVILAAGNGAMAFQQFHAEHAMHGAGWFIGPFMMVAAVTLVAVIVLLLGRWLWRSAGFGATEGKESSIRILEERFARGELRRGEFEEKRRVIGD